MTRNQDFTGQLERYLDEFEGTTPLPSEVRTAIRAQLASTKQRPAPWLAWRIFAMHPMLRFGAAVTAVAGASLLTYGLVSGGLGAGPAQPATPPPATQIPLPEAFEPVTDVLRIDGHMTQLQFELPADGSLTVDRAFAWLLHIHEGGMVGDPGSTWGIDIADLTGATNHRARFEHDPISGDDPAGFLDGLLATGSYSVAEPEVIELDERSALVSEIALVGAPIPSGEGYTAHLDVNGEGGLRFESPNRAYVTEVGDHILMIQVWAINDAELAMHMPLAERIVSSIRFLPEP